MNGKAKQVTNCSIIGVVLLYLIISLCNIFFLPNLSLLNLQLRTAEQYNGNFSPVRKDSKLSRQFKCVVDDRKKTIIPAEQAIAIFSVLLFCPRSFARNFSGHFLEIKYRISKFLSLYLSNQVFRI